jgi:cell division protein FtsI/penicillin-binding protein 2
VRSLGALVVAALLALALVAILAVSFREGSPGVHEPVGYVEEVKRLVREGKLRYDCEADALEVVGLSPAEETFYRHSYLADDMAGWNRGERGAFLWEREELRGGGCQGRITGVNASFHNQRLPGYVANTWEGSLHVRSAVGGTTLTSGERTLEVVPVPWPLLPRMDATAYEDVWLREDVESRRSPRMALKFLEEGRPFATLKYVGDQAVLEIEAERPRVTLNGCPPDPGADWLGWRVRLDGGEGLRLHQARRLDERFAVSAGERAGLVSFLTRVNGEPERRSFPERLPMARDVARAVDAVVSAARAEAPERARDDFDVHLTLDPILSERLEERMTRVLRERYGARRFRAGVTVMEAETGRLLALASYPRLRDLEEPDAPATDPRRQRLGRNHNFLQHGAGSAAKPFLTAAVLAAEPRLSGLEVRCFPGGEPPERLLGYELGESYSPGGCRGADPEGWVGLETFLTVSSNRYMLYLGLLSMAPWGAEGPLAAPGAPPLDPGAEYRLGGRVFRRRPALRVAREETAGGTELQEVDERAGFGRTFQELFDQRVRYRRERTAEEFDLRPWEPVLRAAYGLETGAGGTAADPPPTPRPDAVATFAPVASERVNLRLNLVQQLHQDLYTLLLGNGANRWSNVQLAEALARLVTGRRVEARLVERVVVPPERSGEDEPEVLWELDARQEPGAVDELLSPVLRQRILAGMRGAVARPQGTAAILGGLVERLNGAAPPGVTYSALAKTGTPTLPRSVARQTASDIRPEAVRRYQEGQEPQVESAVLVLAIRREEGGEAENLAVSVFLESQGGSDQAVFLAGALLQPLVETRWPEDWLPAAGQ